MPKPWVKEMYYQRISFTQSYLRLGTSFLPATTVTLHQSSGHFLQSLLITFFVFLSPLKRQAEKPALTTKKSQKTISRYRFLSGASGSGRLAHSNFCFFSSLLFSLYFLGCPVAPDYHLQQSRMWTLVQTFISWVLFDRSFESPDLS